LILQEVISFIPSGITLVIFFAFLQTNKNLKRLKIGSMEYEAKDGAPKVKKKNDKDIKQDECIENIVLKLESLERLFSTDATERKEWQKNTEERQNIQYEYIRDAALQASIAIVWNDSIPFIERLRAAFLSFKLGANGNLRNKLVKIIIAEPNGVTTFRSEVNTYIRDHEKNKKILIPHFYQTIEWIDKQIA